jgi:hypothetical protein
MKITSETIRSIVNDKFKIDISSKCRERRYIDPRFIYALLCKKYTLESTTRIGLTINRHHASILHAIKQGEIYLEQDQEFSLKYLNCKKLIDDRLNWVTNTTIPMKPNYRIHPYRFRKNGESIRKVLIERGQNATFSYDLH